MPGKSFAIIAFSLVLGGCAGHSQPKTTETAPALDWQTMATTYDRQRLRDWRKAWMTALPKAKAEDAQAIAAQGPLFQPDRELAGAMPPPGAYRCRTFKLGAAGTAMHDFTRYPWFTCRIADEDEALGLYKTSGSQRPVGLILPDTAMRSVFLGTMVFGDETTALQYGRDPQRDMAGFVERVGDRRWRLVLPYPHYESTLDVIELVPAATFNQG